ncbi:MAG TPA: hypothetical protein VIL36_02130 [Acidimicrobiales bacterium]
MASSTPVDTTDANGSNGDGDGATPAPATDTTEQQHGYHLEIFLICFASLLLEISYTRVVSFKLFYYYTYLVIGLALLGIGAGGVLVAVSGRLKRAGSDAVVLWGSLTGALSIGVGYVVIAKLPIATNDIWDYGTGASFTNLGRLLLICLMLFASFVSIGVMIATLFGRRSDDIGRLYMADLLGAGLACAIVVYLAGTIGPPAIIFLAGATLAAVGVWTAVRTGGVAPRPGVLVGAPLAVVLLAGVAFHGELPDPKVDDSKPERLGILTRDWSPVFRVDVTDWADRHLLYHDGLLGSNIYRFDNDIETTGKRLGFDTNDRRLPFAVLDEPPENVMIIGAAGGHEILASLYFDARHIDAIELNPVTHSLVTGRFADYAGNIAENPRVNYVNGDGRSFLARSDDEYDLVWYPAPDSYSASNAASAGAFVLSESYLYTSETIVESLEHLSDDGILAAQFGEFNYAVKANRTTRYVSTVRHALQELGIDDPSGHVMVATQDNVGASVASTVLVKRTPFTDDEVDTFVRMTEEFTRVTAESAAQRLEELTPEELAALTGDERAALEDPQVTTVQYAPGHAQDNSVSAVLTLPEDELDDWYEAYPYDVTPITDDGPFFWHFARFGDVIRNIGDPIDIWDTEDATGERVLLLLLVIAAVLAGVFLLLPFVALKDTWKALPRKGTSAVYFASLGLGFMFFEVSLIQRLILFLGYPTYSLTVTLASILLFTGIGAFLTERYKDRTDRALRVLLPAIVVLAAGYLFGLPKLTEALLSWPLMPRIAVAFVILAPLGLCLGAFMPLGLGAVAGLTEHKSEYVAWGWAVNGFASVIGSVTTTLAAMMFGFRAVMVTGLLIYLLAIAALRSLTRAGAAAGTGGAATGPDGDGGDGADGEDEGAEVVPAAAGT